MTEEKKTPIKVTSGVTPPKFEQAPEKKLDPPKQEEPKSIGPSAEELAAHEKRMKELDEQFEKRKAELAAEEKQRMEDLKARAAAAQERLDNELAARKQSFAEADEHPTNSRGIPLSVEEPTEQRPRHISEIDPGYNGKEDTIEEL